VRTNEREEYSPSSRNSAFNSVGEEVVPVVSFDINRADANMMYS